MCIKHEEGEISIYIHKKCKMFSFKRDLRKREKAMKLFRQKYTYIKTTTLM